MSPSQHAAAVVAVAQAHEAVKHLGLEVVVTVQPWTDWTRVPGQASWWWIKTAGVLATVQTIGAVGFEVLSVFVPEVGP